MSKFILYKDISGVLKVKFEEDGVEYSVMPVRYFPFTALKQHVGLFRVSSDGTAGEEVATVASFDELDASSLKLLEEELDKAYPEAWLGKTFSLVSAKKKLYCSSYCKGEKVVFEIRNENAISMIRPNHVIIRSSEGKVYSVNPASLDKKGKVVLDSYL